jgi:hypothetical protein
MKILYWLVEARTYKLLTHPNFLALKTDTLVNLSEFLLGLLQAPIEDFSGPWILKTLDCVLGHLDANMEVDSLAKFQNMSKKFDETLFAFLKSGHKFVSY